MTRNFTIKQIFSHAIMSMALVLISFSLQAQLPNTLTINAPAEIAGDYQFVMAAFGQQLNAPQGGMGTLIDDGTDPTSDGCEPGAGNIGGKVAFIDRGDCQFGTKVLFAENAGASMVIICNNNDDPPFQMVPGDDGDLVNIPAGMISRADCETIRVAFADGDVDLTVLNKCAPPVYGPEVIFGRNPGEGDFDGGLNDWTVETESFTDANTWHWDANGDATGTFTNFQINSATLCNGAMVMSSDSLDNGGTTNLGTGPCPMPCIASIVSPEVDLSTADPSKGFFIQFTQAFRQFTSSYQIIVDKNGAGTWLDTIFLNQDAVVNSPNINETVKIPLQGYTGVQSIQFKFRYIGNYYYWIIDDVTITNESYVDMQLNSNWYAAAPQWRTPASQVSAMPFLVDMFNNGNLDAQNVQVTVDIFDPNGNQVHSQTQDYGEIDAYTLDENTVFDGGTFTPPAETGMYTGYYVVSAESPDPDFTNNNDINNDTINFNFMVTPNHFELVPGVADGGTLRPITDGSIFANGSSSQDIANACGTVFYCPNGEGHAVGNITFGVTAEEQTQSGFVHALLYRWLGDLGGISENDGVDPDERVLVGANTIILDTITGDIGNIEIPIFAVDGNGVGQPGESVFLDNDAQYFLYLSTEPLVPGPQGFQIDLLSGFNTNGFDRNYNHFASNMAFDSTGIDRNPGTYYASGMTTGNVAEASASVPDFYDINTLWTRVVVYDTSTDVDELNEKIGLKAYPNPTSDLLNINIKLENASDVTFDIIDFQGRRVQTDQFDNVQSGTVLINTSALSSGTYLLNIRTDEGTKTQKIVIAR